MTRTVIIDPVTRIEGHAKITLHLDEGGHLVDARFHVVEYRGFEKFCEGRPFTEMAGITARICGICPVSHLLAAAKTGDKLLAVEIPERPGSFLAFCRVLGRRQITEFNYRYADPERAQAFVGVELSRGDEERAELIARLVEKGLGVLDMTDNETAKLHIRHMVGGHAAGVLDETLVRVEFPERPGALLDFLGGIGKRWNITLFHYRNHGAAYGRVLMGAAVPSAERGALLGALDALGYPYWEETGNPAYRIFAGVANG